MVKQISIGVLGIQGAISEHVLMMRKVMLHHGLKNNVHIVRKKTELDKVQGLIIPGGESTTISRFILSNNLYETIKERVQNQSLSVMGTCAGCVLVSSDMADKSKDITLLSLMDMKVKRNAFGRQRESFEQEIMIKGTSRLFSAIFIRAPLILDTWGKCKPLSTINDGIVMAQQKNVLALSFHPELTNDTRIHELFYKIVDSY